MRAIFSFALFAFLLSPTSFAEPPHPDGKHWHDICDRLGERVTVSIVTDEGEQITRDVVIDDKSDRCPGRCGAGCGGPSSYTWECLEHDVCEHAKGRQMGPCLSLMKLAKAGFFFGRRCDDSRN